MSKLATRLEPFESWSPRDQALHLVFDHGYSAGYFDGAPDLTDEQIVAVFEGSLPFAPSAGDGSFPDPTSRKGWHDSDHEQEDAVMLADEAAGNDVGFVSNSDGSTNAHIHEGHKN